MEPMIKELKLRIISEKPEVAERALNALLDTYAVVVWNLSPIGDEMRVTAVLLHQSEIRKAQLMMGGPGPARMS